MELHFESWANRWRIFWGSQRGPFKEFNLTYAAESEVPPRALVEGCLGAFERSGDARFLPPALAGLPSRADALALLPKLLALDAAGLRAALHRLLLPQPETGWALL